MISFHFLFYCLFILIYFECIICTKFNIQTKARAAINSWNQHDVEVGTKSVQDADTNRNRLFFNKIENIPYDNRIVCILESYLGSRSKVAQLGKLNRIKVNGVNQHGTYKIKLNDVLEWESPNVKEVGQLSDKKLFRLESFYNRLLDSIQFSPPLSVVYENNEMAIVFKPAGVHTMPFISTLKNNQLTLCDALPLLLYPPNGSSSSGKSMTALSRPMPVHRLDNRVAGPVVVAKTSKARTFLQQCFENRSITKEYLAILCGCPDSHYTTELIGQSSISPLSGDMGEKEMNDNVDNQRKGWIVITGIASGSEKAISLVTIVDVTPICIPVDLDNESTKTYNTSCYSRVRLWPFSGRRHQLRKHCALLGCPIVGDDLYHDSAMLNIDDERAAAINTAAASATVSSSDDTSVLSYSTRKDDDYIVYEVVLNAGEKGKNDEYGGFQDALSDCVNTSQDGAYEPSQEKEMYTIRKLDSLPSTPSDNAKPSVRRRIGLYLQAKAIQLPSGVPGSDSDGKKEMRVEVDELPKYQKLLDKGKAGWLFHNKSHVQ